MENMNCDRNSRKLAQMQHEYEYLKRNIEAIEKTASLDSVARKNGLSKLRKRLAELSDNIAMYSEQ